MPRIAPALALLVLAAPAVAAPPIRGVALGLFSEDAGWSYRPLLDEIVELGADHVELVVPWYLADVTATEVRDHPRFTPPAAAIARAVDEAHQAGLKVFLFPIVRLERAGDNEWRGTLRPRDRDALFRSYTRRLVELAGLAATHHAELFSVGSELSTLDQDRAAWERVIAAVRGVYRGALTYSGNWDHYQKVAFYDRLDYLGLCGYFALAEPGKAAPDGALVARWRALRQELERFRTTVGKPLLFTEVGYLSQRGAAAWPWAEGAKEPVDLEEQRRCYAAFRAAWSDPGPALGGLFFWNWYGWGGPRSRGYTPRGKPAAREIRALFRAWR